MIFPGILVSMGPEFIPLPFGMDEERIFNCASCQSAVLHISMNRESIPNSIDAKKERIKARALRGSQWWKRQLAEGLCVYCNQTFTASELTMDHRIPVSRGGRSTKGNVVPCCKSCNTYKKNLTPAEIILDQMSKSPF